MKKYNKVLKEEKSDAEKAKEIIDEVIDSKWSGSNESQGKMLELMKGIAFNDSEISNKFMKDLDTLTSKMNKDDYKV